MLTSSSWPASWSMSLRASFLSVVSAASPVHHSAFKMLRALKLGTLVEKMRSTFESLIISPSAAPGHCTWPLAPSHCTLDCTPLPATCNLRLAVAPWHLCLAIVPGHLRPAIAPDPATYTLPFALGLGQGFAPGLPFAPGPPFAPVFGRGSAPDLPFALDMLFAPGFGWGFAPSWPFVLGRGFAPGLPFALAMSTLCSHPCTYGYFGGKGNHA